MGHKMTVNCDVPLAQATSIANDASLYNLTKLAKHLRQVPLGDIEDKVADEDTVGQLRLGSVVGLLDRLC